MELKTDVVIVGAGIAGCAAALFYARKNLKVVIVDRKKKDQYKVNCTHFIQPVGVLILKRLNLFEDIKKIGGAKHGLNMHLPSGTINHEELFGTDSDIYGFNIQRELLDPYLIKVLEEESNVTFLEQHVLKSITYTNDIADGIVVSGSNGRIEITANLVVAADGAHSKIAKLTKNEAKLNPSNKFTFFTYYKGIDIKTSAHWVLDDASVYAGALGDGVVLFGLFFNNADYDDWKNCEDMDTKVLQFIAKLKEIPSLDNAERIDDFIWMLNIDNLYRSPVKNGIAFIGDAAMKTNPVSGTGCAFALNTAEWLYKHTMEFFDNKKTKEEALSEYSKSHKDRLTPHFEGISTLSASEALSASEKDFYDLIITNDEISRQYLKLIYRIITPEEFQKQLLSNLLLSS
ncbi:FAD-dependent monooxygenase [Kordia sp. YSTF-M3]|uniref:FAD-dependent monooxygenase n=1 Tax=Kordia aestuariivivens TaxID=2759037 RepID=A0ABR7QE80_9FLAO|nr:FAD-dependent oxidoreductase [Kordia aestuariivivens]MBC8756880.1 FAD-dependent monooxygenase [Kordia aestuariivivens]